MVRHVVVPAVVVLVAVAVGLVAFFAMRSTPTEVAEPSMTMTTVAGSHVAWGDEVRIGDWRLTVYKPVDQGSLFMVPVRVKYDGSGLYDVRPLRNSFKLVTTYYSAGEMKEARLSWVHHQWADYPAFQPLQGANIAPIDTTEGWLAFEKLYLASVLRVECGVIKGQEYVSYADWSSEAAR